MDTEIQGFLTEFGIIRKEIRHAVQGLNDQAANWHPLPNGTNSIYSILTHLIDSDNFWVRQVIRGETLTRDREAGFRTAGSLAELLVRWEKSWTEIESILGALSHAQLSEIKSHVPPAGQKESVTVQWIVLHLITHQATHLGHIQLTRQLWEQQHS